MIMMALPTYNIVLRTVRQMREMRIDTGKRIQRQNGEKIEKRGKYYVFYLTLICPDELKDEGESLMQILVHQERNCQNSQYFPHIL